MNPVLATSDHLGQGPATSDHLGQGPLRVVPAPGDPALADATRKREHQTLLAGAARKRRQKESELQLKQLHERIAALQKTNTELLQRLVICGSEIFQVQPHDTHFRGFVFVVDDEQLHRIEWRRHPKNRTRTN